MTRPGIEPWSSGPLANSVLIRRGGFYISQGYQPENERNRLTEDRTRLLRCRSSTL